MSGGKHVAKPPQENAMHRLDLILYIPCLAIKWLPYCVEFILYILLKTEIFSHFIAVLS
jgi:hypothetical protein